MLLGILAGGAALVALVVAVGAFRRRGGSASLGDGSRALFEDHPLPMWVFELDTLRFLAVNDAAVVRYGWPREEFLRMRLEDLRAPEDVPALREAHAREGRRRGLQGVFRHRTRAGETLHVEIITHDTVFDGRRARIVHAHDVTARVHAEQALRESEARFRAAFEQAAVGVMLSSLDGTCENANQRFAAMLGHEPAELVGRTLADLTYAPDLARSREHLARLARGEISTYAIEKRYVRKDGTPLWAAVTSSHVHGASGESAALAFVEDITARRRAEEERARSEELLRRRSERLAAMVAAQQDITAATLALDDALPRLLREVLAVTGADGAGVGSVHGEEIVFEVVTGAAAPPVGFRVTAGSSLSGFALRARGLAVCHDAEDDPRVDREVMRGLKMRSLATLPLVYNGETLGLLVVGASRAHAFGDEEAQAVQLLGGMLAAAMSHARELDARQRTIAERTSALAALRDREEQLRTVTDGVPLLIAYVDAEQRYRFVNAEYEAVFGRPRDEILGRTIREVFGAQAHGLLRGWIEAALAGRRVSFEVDLPLADGRRRRSAVSYVPRRSDAGEVVGFFTMSADRTEHGLLEEQLRQSQKMDAVGQLAGGVAHDFNNLLTVITSITQLLLDDGALGDGQREDVAEIRHAAERASDLTRKLLAFSRRQTLQPRVVDLNAVVLEAERLLRRLVRADLELAPELAPAPCLVFADPAQLEQVLVNLVVNARDATPGAGRIAIRTEEVVLDAEGARRIPGLLPGPHVRLTVSDTGEGMTPEVAARAFEPFFTTKPQGKGTGLGLATVYGIVKQSGGAACIDAAAPGRGVTVAAWLPRTAAAPSPSPRPAPAPPGGSETILLVEDEENVRLVAKRVLEARGYRVLCARHGKEALAVAGAAGEAIQLLVTDVVMPEMGGRELAARLASSRPSLPVLFTSGYAAGDLGEGGVVDGAVAYLQKPFTPDALSRAVREALAPR